jgi:hypothetical protein
LDKLKEVEFEASFMIVPLLIHADPSKSFVLETNAFNFALGVMFSQLEDDDLFHPVNFHSHKFFLLRLTARFMIKNFWPLLMFLKNGVIYSKELNMKSLCTLIIKTSSIS